MTEYPIVQQAADLDALDAVLCRMCETDAERVAVKRALGVDRQEARVTDSFTPEPPPAPDFRPQIDHLERAHVAVARYAAWVDSYPDTDTTPLSERERVLRKAHMDLQRLEGDTP